MTCPPLEARVQRASAFWRRPRYFLLLLCHWEVPHNPSSLFLLRGRKALKKPKSQPPDCKILSEAVAPEWVHSWQKKAAQRAQERTSTKTRWVSWKQQDWAGPARVLSSSRVMHHEVQLLASYTHCVVAPEKGKVSWDTVERKKDKSGTWPVSR